MNYQLVLAGNYPNTNLPVYRVFDAGEYNDPAVRYPRAIGTVWAVGVPGVSDTWVHTGVRWQLTGACDVSPLLPVGAYSEAARAMVAAYEGKSCPDTTVNGS